MGGQNWVRKKETKLPIWVSWGGGGKELAVIAGLEKQLEKIGGRRGSKGIIAQTHRTAGLGKKGGSGAA